MRGLRIKSKKTALAAAIPTLERSAKRPMQRGALPSLWFRQIGMKSNVGGNQGGGRGGCGGARNHGRRYRRGNLLNLGAGSENRDGDVVGAITVVRGIVVV